MKIWKYWKSSEIQTRLVFIAMLVMSIAAFVLGEYILGAAELCATIILWTIAIKLEYDHNNAIKKQGEEFAMTVGSAAGRTVKDFPMPVVVIDHRTCAVVWSNNIFSDLSVRYNTIEDLLITDIFPDFDQNSIKSLINGSIPYLTTVFNGVTYRVFGRNSHSEEAEFEELDTLMFIDISEELKLEDELVKQSPAVMLLQIDNVEEMTKELSNFERTFIVARIESVLSDWAEKGGAVMVRGERGIYTLLMDHKSLETYIMEKFSVLEEAHKITNPSGMPATLSIGAGYEGDTYAENLQFARLAMDMSLSRGGDQAVIKNKLNYQFFGGNTREIEKRTKVRSRVVASAIQELVNTSTRVIIMGHKFSDMDSIGSSCGVACLCRALKVPANIVYDGKTTSAAVLYDKLSSEPKYDGVFISGDRAMELMDDDTLLVVCDVNRPEITEAPQLLTKAKRVVVIDHHRRASSFIENSLVSLHEPYASSASELISEVLQYIVYSQDILRTEAECMLAGIMLDTKNFTMKTGVRTFESAAFLRRAGADTIEVKRLFQNDMDGYLDKVNIIRTAENYHKDIAIAYYEKDVKREIAAQAADELLNIRGVLGSFVVFRFNGSTNISGRSMGKVNVQVILEKLGGGGSMMEAGAQPGDRPVRDIVKELKKAIDSYYSKN